MLHYVKQKNISTVNAGCQVVKSHLSDAVYHIKYKTQLKSTIITPI